MPGPVTTACSDEASPPLTPRGPGRFGRYFGRHQRRPLPRTLPRRTRPPSPRAPASAAAPHRPRPRPSSRPPPAPAAGASCLSRVRDLQGTLHHRWHLRWHRQRHPLSSHPRLGSVLRGEPSQRWRPHRSPRRPPPRRPPRRALAHVWRSPAPACAHARGGDQTSSGPAIAPHWAEGRTGTPPPPRPAGSPMGAGKGRLPGILTSCGGDRPVRRGERWGGAGWGWSEGGGGGASCER